MPAPHRWCYAHRGPAYENLQGGKPRWVGAGRTRALWGFERGRASASVDGGDLANLTAALGRLHDRQVGGLLAFEYPAGIDAGLTLRVGNARPVAHQSADIDGLAQGIDRRYP